MSRQRGGVKTPAATDKENSPRLRPDSPGPEQTQRPGGLRPPHLRASWRAKRTPTQPRNPDILAPPRAETTYTLESWTQAQLPAARRGWRDGASCRSYIGLRRRPGPPPFASTPLIWPRRGARPAPPHT